MRRPLVIALIALAVVLFLVISALLARAFSAEGAERGAITSLVKAEAGGDRGDVVDEITGCRVDPACRARIAAEVAALSHAGSVSILTLAPSTSFSIVGTTGTARVAWDVGGSLPITQCVRVRRVGNVLSGLRIELLAITPRLPADANCPVRF
jgi:hypothetical protein